MTLSRDTLADVAAVAGAEPSAVMRLSTVSGETVVVGHRPDGAMCTDGFRRLLASWVDGYEPQVVDVEFVGADYQGGMLAVPGSRLFVTRLAAEDVVEVLRAREDWPQEAHATVRQDALLDVAVVQVLSTALDAVELEEAAREAQAACMVEELVREVAAA